MSLCPGQNYNQAACRRKLNMPCLSFYYLASNFHESLGLVGMLRECSFGHSGGSHNWTGIWQHSKAPGRVEQFSSVSPSKIIKYASD